MKYLIFAVLFSSCATVCGTERVTKSTDTIRIQRGYGLSYHPPDSSIFVTERLAYETKKYQLWEVTLNEERYSVEYFAPTRREPGFARCLRLRDAEWLDCEEMFEILDLMTNKYPY